MTLDFTNMIDEVDPNLFVPPDNCIETFDLVSLCSLLMIIICKLDNASLRNFKKLQKVPIYYGCPCAIFA